MVHSLYVAYHISCLNYIVCYFWLPPSWNCNHFSGLYFFPIPLRFSPCLATVHQQAFYHCFVYSKFWFLVYVLRHLLRFSPLLPIKRYLFFSVFATNVDVGIFIDKFCYYGVIICKLGCKQTAIIHFYSHDITFFHVRRTFAVKIINKVGRYQDLDAIPLLQEILEIICC